MKKDLDTRMTPLAVWPTPCAPVCGFEERSHGS
jgi:hypothetical protein